MYRNSRNFKTIHICCTHNTVKEAFRNASMTAVIVCANKQNRSFSTKKENSFRYLMIKSKSEFQRGILIILLCFLILLIFVHYITICYASYVHNANSTHTVEQLAENTLNINNACILKQYNIRNCKWDTDKYAQNAYTYTETAMWSCWRRAFSL